MESTRSGCFGARLDQRAASGWKLPATFARLLSSRRSQDQCKASELTQVAGPVLRYAQGCGAPMPARVGGAPSFQWLLR